MNIDIIKKQLELYSTENYEELEKILDNYKTKTDISSNNIHTIPINHNTNNINNTSNIPNNYNNIHTIPIIHNTNNIHNTHNTPNNYNNFQNNISNNVNKYIKNDEIIDLRKMNEENEVDKTMNYFNNELDKAMNKKKEIKKEIEQPSKNHESHKIETNNDVEKIPLTLSLEKRNEISKNTKEFLLITEKIKEYTEQLKILRNRKTELETQLLNDFETYQLPDIIKGKNKIKPKIKKGSTGIIGKKQIIEKMKEFINTLGIVEDPNILMEKAMEYIKKTTPKQSDKKVIQHIKML